MKNFGFTLVELLIAMFVGAVIMTAIYGVMNQAQRSTANVDRKIITQQDARAVLDFMAMEIRMASYNPTYRKSTWTDTTDTACMPAVEARKGIQNATGNMIAIAMDLDRSGRIGDADNEYIVYNYNNVNQAITRETACGGVAQPLLGGTLPFSNVINNAQNVPVFQYFDRDDNQIPFADLPARIPDIRSVLITIAAETTSPDLNSGQTRKMVHSTNVMVRNHVFDPFF